LTGSLLLFDRHSALRKTAWLRGGNGLLGSSAIGLSEPASHSDHIDLKHDSQLAGLLEKSTQMPECEATDGLILRSNRVYIMPSNVLMTVASGRLVLAPRGDALLPIDFFCARLRRIVANWRWA
jgi:CheB methylesterase